MIARSSTAESTLYSMRAVTRMTGLTQDTIRVWERRYQAVSPQRTDGNARRYSPGDVRRLQLLKEATSLGHLIHSVAQASESELDALIVASQTDSRTPVTGSKRATTTFHALRAEYLDAIDCFDVQRAARVLHRAAVLLMRDDFLFELVLPTLREVGDRWQAKSFGIAQEHLVSAQLRALLQSDLRFGAAVPGAQRMIIATPSGEQHEFGALLGALLAASRGFEPIYLGPSVPWGEIGIAVEKSGARLVLLGLLREIEPSEVDGHEGGLRQLVSGGARVWLGLPSIHALNGRVPGVRYFDTFESLDLALIDEAERA